MLWILLINSFLKNNIPIDTVEDYEEINSIDEAAMLLDDSLEPEMDSWNQLKHSNKILKKLNIKIIIQMIFYFFSFHHPFFRKIDSNAIKKLA